MEIPLESAGNPRNSERSPQRGKKFIHSSKEEALTHAPKEERLPHPCKGGIPPIAPRRRQAHPSKQEGGAYQCARKEKSSHPPKEGVPPSAPRSRQAHQSAARREELTNALKRKSLPIPPKREPHPMHQVEVKPTRCTKEGTSSPIPPRSYHSIIRFLLDYHVAINFNITKVSL